MENTAKKNFILKGFQIRVANNKDIPAIKKLVFDALKEFGFVPDEKGTDIDLNDIEKFYTNHNGYFGVLTSSDGNIKGTFGMHYIDNKTCEIRKMYLHPDIRGKGFGKLMLNYLIANAREMGYQKIILETSKILNKAIELYRKYGFKETDDKPEASRCDKSFELIL